MQVNNVHRRRFRAPPEQLGQLIDSLTSRSDRLWPHHLWPRMRLDRPLGVDAAGGHGPIRYQVEAYRPGISVHFRFTAPKGFDGRHWLQVFAHPDGGSLLQHSIEMNTRGLANLTWPLVYQPMHDALIEDAFSCAAIELGEPLGVVPWNGWVRLLRALLSRGRSVEQHFLARSPRESDNERQPTAPEQVNS